MSTFRWTPEYSVNVEKLDNQHKKLIALMDELLSAMKTGQGKAVVDKTVGELYNYTVTHFTEEEELMSQAAYTELDAHKEKHKEFVTKVAELMRKLQEGKQSTMTAEVLMFMFNWLQNHIKRLDKQYSPVLNAKGIN